MGVRRKVAPPYHSTNARGRTAMIGVGIVHSRLSLREVKIHERVPGQAIVGVRDVFGYIFVEPRQQEFLGAKVGCGTS